MLWPALVGLQNECVAFLKKWNTICPESHVSTRRKLVTAVSVGDVSTTQSKFLEPGGLAEARRSGPALGSSKAQIGNRVEPWG